MLRLEGFMEIQKLHHEGLSEIARQLDLDRKTVRKYLRQPPGAYERKPRSCKVDPYQASLRERWEAGVHNASRLFREIQKRGYSGGSSQLRAFLSPWRSEGRDEHSYALRLGERGSSFTASELRWVYRNRLRPEVQEHVQFWKARIPVPPPWDRSTEEGDAWDAWEAYKPKRVWPD